jgi:hypothetical protein
VSTATRLARLEGTLSPKEATLAWLADAHQFPTLVAYVGWLVDQPKEAAPFWRVPEQAKASVRAAMRGQPRDVVEATAHQAVRDAVFLVELVLRLNGDAAERLRVEELRYAALSWEAWAIGAAGELKTDPHGREAITRRWAAWRDAATGWLENLDAAEAARRLLESRYLHGHGSLFPDLAAGWQALREQAERLAGFGTSVAVHRKDRSRAAGPRTPAPTTTTLSRRADADAASIADTAGRATLDLLGDTDGAAANARSRLLPAER